MSPRHSRLALEAAKKKKMEAVEGKLEPGDYVKAHYHADNAMHPGILLDIEGEGEGARYVVTWDEPDEKEPISGCKKCELLKKAKKPIPNEHKQIFNVGDYAA